MFTAKNARSIGAVWLLAVLLALPGCTASKSAAATTGDIAQETGLEAVARQFTEAVRTGDIKLLSGYFVDVAMARKMSPAETKEMSDRLIQLQMIEGLTQRFEDNLGKLRESASSTGLSPGEIQYFGITEYPSTDPELVPRVLGVKMGNKKIQGEIPVTYLEHEGRVYLFEILNTTRIFK